MTQRPVYASMIDAILDDLAPANDEELSRGRQFSELTKGQNGDKFLEEIAGKSHHTPVQSQSVTANAGNTNQLDWQNKRVDGKLGDSSSILSAALAGGSAQGVPSLSDADVKAKIKELLNSGMTIAKVASFLEDMAGQVSFSKSPSYEFLSSQAGLLGLSYIEPDHFMSSCSKTAAKLGKNSQAYAVKRIKACDNCSACANRNGGAYCTTHEKPIASDGVDLEKILVSATGLKGAKLASFLRTKHTGSAPEIKYASGNGIVPTAYATGVKSVEITEATAADVEKLLKEGATLAAAHSRIASVQGTPASLRAVKAYITSLKGSNQRINTEQVPCSLLKGKLASTEALLGSAKCKTCYARHGMACSITGGTLLSFPGMESVEVSKKASLEGASLGRDLVNEFEMNGDQVSHEMVVESEEFKPLEVDARASFIVE